MPDKRLTQIEAELEPAKVARTINYRCGCMGTYHKAGDLAKKGWQLIPCSSHHKYQEIIRQEVLPKIWGKHVD